MRLMFSTPRCVHAGRQLSVFILCLFGLVVAAAELSAEPTVKTVEEWHLPTDQAAAIDALWTTAIAHGLPDARGAQVWQGTLRVRQTAGSLPENHDLAAKAGLHLRLADGRWLMQCCDEALPANAVDTSAMHRLPATALTPTDGARQAWAAYAEGRFAGELPTEQVPEFRRRALAAAALLGNIDLEQFAPRPRLDALAHLRRAGVPGADAALALFAQQGWGPLAMRQWWASRAIAQQPRLLKKPIVQALAAGLRMELATFFFSHRGSEADPDASVLRFAGGDAWMQEALRRARAALPANTVTSDSAGRLQRWVTYGDFETKQDAPACSLAEGLALLDDPRAAPDFGTVGDRALMAVNFQLGFDARLLIGRDVSAEWTPSERHICALALQAWWREHGQETPTQWALAAADQVDAGGALQLLNSGAADVPQRFTHIARRWQEPPADLEAERWPWWTDVISFLPDQTAVETLIRSWPVSGRLRDELALWRDAQGEPQPLDATLRDACATATDPIHAQALERLTIGVLQQPPRATRILALRNVLEGPVEAPAFLAVLFGARGVAGATANSTLPSVPSTDGCLVLLHHALHDRRRLPPVLSRSDAAGLWLLGAHGALQLHSGLEQPELSTEPIPQVTIPADLRVADVAASLLGDLHAAIGAVALFPIVGPLAERDAALDELAEHLEPFAQEAAHNLGLPPLTAPMPPSNF